MAIERAVLDRDEMLGITEIIHADDVTGDFTIESLQDVTEIVEINRTLFAAMDERARFGGDLVRKMSIPALVFAQLVREGRAPHQDEAAFKKWANDPDNRFFHVRPGRI